MGVYKGQVTTPATSAFGRFAEWLGSKIVGLGTASVIVALVSMPLGFSHTMPMYGAAAIMFLIAQVFIVRWMFGTGVRSVAELGFGSNRQALKYGLLMRGFDKNLRLLAFASFGAALILGILDFGQTVSGAMLLAFMTFGAVTQAMRLNRFWPADKTY